MVCFVVHTNVVLSDTKITFTRQNQFVPERISQNIYSTKLSKICPPIGMRSCIQPTCLISIISKNTKIYARNSKSLFKCYSRSYFRKLNDKGEGLTKDFNIFHIDKNCSKLISHKTSQKKFPRTILYSRFSEE